MIRCSSCGAPREDSAEACRFCGAEFTLHARDLDTICSGCMARVSGKARFCHSCAAPVLVRQGAMAKEETDLRCPACAGGRPLVSRQLGRSNVALFECAACAGLWIDKEIFEVLADRARSEALPDLDLRPAERRTPAAPAKGPFYRTCVVCGGRMNRRNYGQKSGVIVDVCQHHGVWFDLHELEDLLRWLRNGGERLAQHDVEAERAAVRHLAISGTLRTLDAPSGLGRSAGGSVFGGFLGGVLRGLFEK